jgi:PAS domain S-box-containing protein
LFGYTKDEFRNIKLDDFLLGDTEKMRELAMTALNGNGRFQSSCDLKRKDGKIVSVEIAVNLTEADEDEGIYLLVSIRNAD